MKLLYYIIPIIFIFLSCQSKKPYHPELAEQSQGIYFDTTRPKPINYDSMCVVGRKYFICEPGSDMKNPFHDPRHNVIILKKISGYVQYCEFGDYKKYNNKYTFNRTCEDFIALVNYCK